MYGSSIASSIASSAGRGSPQAGNGVMTKLGGWEGGTRGGGEQGGQYKSSALPKLLPRVPDKGRSGAEGSHGAGDGPWIYAREREGALVGEQHIAHIRAHGGGSDRRVHALAHGDVARALPPPSPPPPTREPYPVNADREAREQTLLM